MTNGRQNVFLFVCFGNIIFERFIQKLFADIGLVDKIIFLFVFKSFFVPLCNLIIIGNVVCSFFEN